MHQQAQVSGVFGEFCVLNLIHRILMIPGTFSVISVSLRIQCIFAVSETIWLVQPFQSILLDFHISHVDASY